MRCHTNGAWKIVVHSNTFKAELVFSPENTTRIAKYWETCRSWVRVMRQAKCVDSAIGVCIKSSSNNPYITIKYSVLKNIYIHNIDITTVDTQFDDFTPQR